MDRKEKIREYNRKYYEKNKLKILTKKTNYNKPKKKKLNYTIQYGTFIINFD